MLAYTGKLRRKGLPFLGFRYEPFRERLSDKVHATTPEMYRAWS